MRGVWFIQSSLNLRSCLVILLYAQLKRRLKSKKLKRRKKITVCWDKNRRNVKLPPFPCPLLSISSVITPPPTHPLCIIRSHTFKQIVLNPHATVQIRKSMRIYFYLFAS